ncbi:MAG: glycine--tRNA ligase [Minisyncoccia bacterium]
MADRKDTLMEKIVSLCKRRGFVFPSSEIYGGFAATYDFGPLGFLLKKNIEKVWRRWNVESREDMVEIEGAIFLHPKVWEASGHVGGFADLLVEDLVTHKRYRADHLIEDAKIMENAGALKVEEVDVVIKEHGLKSPDGNPLSSAKRFNLLVKTHLGPVEDDSTVVYLKGESCQNIYVDWKPVLETTHRKLPFGIAQIGKAFRNEITVKNFIFRTREFEQMDIQYFCKPDEADAWYEYWKKNRQDFYTQAMAFSPDRIKWRQHDPDERAFYAKDAWDVQYKFGEIGFQEVEGVHHRGNYDLTQHQKFSGTDLSYFDEASGERFLPYIVECSGGFNRLFLAVMFEAYHEDENRIWLSFPPKLAPYKAAVFPLLKNKPELVQKARGIYENLHKKFMVAWDDRGNIGKRYYAQDEIGTPYCITIDFDTLEKGDVTVRDRDTAKQERIKIEDLEKFLSEKLE